MKFLSICFTTAINQVATNFKNFKKLQLYMRCFSPYYLNLSRRIWSCACICWSFAFAVDYLDVTLNLSDGSYKPFYKPNSEINCIDKESNHPPSIITSLHLSVESPLLKLSFAEDVFTEEASLYQEALKRARRNHKLSYNNYFILTTIIL